MKKFLSENVIKKNHLAICATVAATTTFMGGMAIGILTLVILTIQMAIISVVAKNLCTNCRVFVSLMVGAGLASLANIIMQTYFYSTAQALGWFIPLIAVSGLMVVLVPQAADISTGRAAAMGLVAGLGYALVLIVLGFVREILGYSSIFGINLGFTPMALIATPFGGFLMLGFVIALMQWLCNDKDEREVEK